MLFLTLHNDLESKSSFLCEAVISHGFITSSIVTAAIALMLVETVLWEQKQEQPPQCASFHSAGPSTPQCSHCSNHLKVPLYAHARKRPGKPGWFRKMSKTMYGMYYDTVGYSKSITCIWLFKRCLLHLSVYLVRCRYFPCFERITVQVQSKHHNATGSCTAHDKTQTQLVNQQRPAV